MIAKRCEVCRVAKLIAPYRANTFRTCSHKCFAILKAGGQPVERQCRQCGKIELLSPWRASHPFCSQRCYGDSMKLLDPSESRRDLEAKRVKDRRYKTKKAFRKFNINEDVGDLTTEQWKQILAHYDGRCAYCRKRSKLTMDHVIPNSKGGRHVASNVVPACLPCNQSKKDRIILPADLDDIAKVLQ